MNRAEERLLDPPPGGRIEAARAHGVDLVMLVEERVRDLERAAAGLDALRGKTRRRAGSGESRA